MKVPLRSLSIRLLTLEDLAFADSLRALAGWNQTLADWRRLLALEPAGCFLAECNGSPAGVITTTTYGTELAWIGMALVHPEYRRRGIGRALLQHALEYLHQKQIRCVKLDATPQGQPLYESLGFKPEWTLTRWERAPHSSLTPAPEPSDQVCEPRPQELIDSVAPLDLAAFGANRTTLLHSLAEDATALFLHSHSRGYALLRPGSRAFYLGPVVASSAETALPILAAALSKGRAHPIFWDIPDACLPAQTFARQRSFSSQRSLTRMYLGLNSSPGEPHLIYGIASPELG